MALSAVHLGNAMSSVCIRRLRRGALARRRVHVTVGALPVHRAAGRGAPPPSGSRSSETPEKKRIKAEHNNTTSNLHFEPELSGPASPRSRSPLDRGSDLSGQPPPTTAISWWTGRPTIIQARPYPTRLSATKQPSSRGVTVVAEPPVAPTASCWWLGRGGVSLSPLSSAWRC
jgi:hypothetical protein